MQHPSFVSHLTSLYKCPPGAEYIECGPACIPSCEDPSTNCSGSCISGCFCKPGFVFKALKTFFSNCAPLKCILFFL
uniref:TIL domain-containing protein n=1 Tax=Gadus morhua TaxID=8049 RepID=A0A8C5A6A3_GADMO